MKMAPKSRGFESRRGRNVFFSFIFTLYLDESIYMQKFLLEMSRLISIIFPQQHTNTASVCSFLILNNNALGAKRFFCTIGIYYEPTFLYFQLLLESAQ